MSFMGTRRSPDTDTPWREDETSFLQGYIPTGGTRVLFSKLLGQSQSTFVFMRWPVLPPRLSESCALGIDSANGGPLWWSSSWECTCQHRGREFDPWCENQDPTFHEATKAMLCNKGRPQWEALAPQLESSPCSLQSEKSRHSSAKTQSSQR